MGEPIDYCYGSRKAMAAGALGALSLGEFKKPRRLASSVCKNHRWRVAKWSRTCTRCGFVEDRS